MGRYCSVQLDVDWPIFRKSYLPTATMGTIFSSVTLEVTNLSAGCASGFRVSPALFRVRSKSSRRHYFLKPRFSQPCAETRSRLEPLIKLLCSIQNWSDWGSFHTGSTWDYQSPV